MFITYFPINKEPKMKASLLAILAVVSLGVMVVGCSSSTKPATEKQATTEHDHMHAHATEATTDNAEIKKSLAELSDADRSLAQAQRVCPVSKDSALGSMGKPYKVMVDGQPVFLCCEACKE